VYSRVDLLPDGHGCMAVGGEWPWRMRLVQHGPVHASDE